MNSNKMIIKSLLVAIGLAVCLVSSEAKLFGRSRYYENDMDQYYPSASVRTGERAILTVRGARNPYDGSAPSRLAIEDNPLRGPLPRGVYDRLDSGYGRYPIYPDAYR